MTINLIPHPQKTKRVLYKTLNIIATLALILNTSLFGVFLTPKEAHASTDSFEIENVCPTGNVKYEIDDGYEYTDGSATITGNGDQVEWEATPGFTITGVCIKSATELFNPDPIDGTYTKDGHDISHVVVYTESEPEMGKISVRKDVWDANHNNITDNHTFYVIINNDNSTIQPIREDLAAEFIVPVGVTQTITEVNIDPNYEFVMFSQVDEDPNTPGAQITITDVDQTVYLLVKNKLKSTTPTVCTLEITKSVDKENAVPGDTLNYTINYQNTGNAVCTGGGVKVYDVLDNYLSYVADSRNIEIFNDSEADGYHGGDNYNGKGNTMLYNVQRVSPGESGEITFQAKVTTKFDCGKYTIPNKGKIWSDQTSDLWSKKVKTDVIIPCDGKLTVVKKVVGSNVLSSEWTMNVAGPTPLNFAGSNIGITNTVTAGDYTITESNDPSGYTLTYSGDCNDQGKVTIANGDNKTCTLTNTLDTGNLRIKKYNDLDGDGSMNNSDYYMTDWEFTVTQNGNFIADGFTGEDGQWLVIEDLPTGTYQVTETQQDDWINTEPGGTAPITKTVEVRKENIVEYNNVWFGNHKLNKPTITLNKVVINNHGGEANSNDFGLTIGDISVNSGETLDVSANTPYALNEAGLAGYEFVSITGDEGCPANLGDTVTLDYEESIECTITNKDIAPKLTLVKEVTNLDGGDNLAEEWTLTATGDNGFSGKGTPQDSTENKATLGPKTVKANITYTLSESGPDGYNPSSWVCVGGVQENNTITLGLDESATCTIINDDEIPTITLIKKVNNNHGGTAGINDFNLKIGDTIVTSGDPLNVMANTPYALNEADLTGTGYEFVSITGDEECPSKLGDTVKLNEGEDITCTITNKDLPGRIEGYKFDTDENPLNGWEICLVPKNVGLIIPTTTTEAIAPRCVKTGDSENEWEDGYYEFNNLSAGSYIVNETPQDGWFAVNPITGIHNSIEVTLDNTSYADFINQLNQFDVEIDKSAPAIVTAGDQMTYTLDWSITGNTPVDAYVSDELPANTTFVSSPTGSYDPTTNTITWDLGTVTPDDNGTVTFVVTVASPLDNETIIENTGEVCGTGYIVPEGENEIFNDDGTTKCDSDTTTTTVEAVPILGIEKTNDADTALTPGDQVNYTVAWSVDGNSKATNVTLTDTIPSEITIDESTISNSGIYDPASRIITWNLGTQVPHAEGFVTYSGNIVTPLANGTTIINVAKITSNETDPIFWEDDSVVTVKSAPVLTIDKSVNKEWVNPGNTAEYTVVVTNEGTDAAINVQLSDLLPAGFVFQDTGLATKTWTLDDRMEVGESSTVTYTVIIGEDIAKGSYDNLAVAWADNHGNVTDFVPLEVRIPTILGEEALPELVLTKSVDKTFINPGGTATYTVKVENIGDASAINVKLQDLMPAGFTFENGDVTKTWSLGDIMDGDSVEISYLAKANDSILPGTYENLAVTWADNYGNVTDSVKLDVREIIVLGEELPTTGGSAMPFLYVLAAALVLLFSAYTLKLTISKEK